MSVTGLFKITNETTGLLSANMLLILSIKSISLHLKFGFGTELEIETLFQIIFPHERKFICLNSQRESFPWRTINRASARQ